MTGTSTFDDDLAELAREVLTRQRLNASALQAAVILSHELPPALVVPLPPDWKEDDDPCDAAKADEVNETARKIERATVARTLRIAEQFAAYIKIGMSAETEAQLEFALGDDMPDDGGHR
jgi:hypothetical protein